MVTTPKATIAISQLRPAGDFHGRIREDERDNKVGTNILTILNKKNTNIIVGIF